MSLGIPTTPRTCETNGGGAFANFSAMRGWSSGTSTTSATVGNMTSFSSEMEGTLVQPRAVRSGQDQPSVASIALESTAEVGVASTEEGW